VLAEVTKAAGAPVRLALPPGGYQAIVKLDDGSRRCPLELAEGPAQALALERCAPIPPEEAVPKSDDERRRRWQLELGVGLSGSRQDGYRDRLGTFGFEKGPSGNGGDFHLSLVRPLSGRFSLVVRLELLEQASLQRVVRTQDAESRQTMSWQTLGLGAFVRAGWPLLDGLWTPYLQAGGGLALGFTHYRDDTGAPDDRQTFAGYELAALGGIELAPWRGHVGFFLQISESFAPVVRNLLGDVHDSGGLMLSLGIRAAF
jgi:hypothetical protein